jgi:hypothetical protein
MRTGIWYACCKCSNIITDWSISRRADGRLHMLARCCGQEQEFIRAFDMAGVLFSDETPGTDGYRELAERFIPFP